MAEPKKSFGMGKGGRPRVANAGPPTFSVTHTFVLPSSLWLGPVHQLQQRTRFAAPLSLASSASRERQFLARCRRLGGVWLDRSKYDSGPVADTAQTTRMTPIRTWPANRAPLAMIVCDTKVPARRQRRVSERRYCRAQPQRPTPEKPTMGASDVVVAGSDSPLSAVCMVRTIVAACGGAVLAKIERWY